MRILVCGGRDYADPERVYGVLDQVHAERGITVLIDGDARGADRIGGEWAKARGVTSQKFPADWQTHGRAAGPIRNQQMLDEGHPDAVIAFGGGRGTDDMVRRSRETGLPVWEIDRGL